MPLRISKEKLIELTGAGAASAEQRISAEGLEFDSRQIKGGELFIGLKGEQTHGQNFADQALARGAGLVLVEDPELLTKLDSSERVLVVTDALEALWKIAAWWRMQLKIPVVAVTGSVGKTTVKDLTAAILLKHSRGVYSLKSYNNHVGVPHTICRIGNEHHWAVIEIGMNHPGEIAKLTEIARPTIGLITGIAPVHTHVFATIDQLADAKTELLLGIPGEGVLILNADDACLRAAVDRRPESKRLRKLYFGHGVDADLQILGVKSLGLVGIECELKHEAKQLALKLRLLGKHNAINCAAAVLAAQTAIKELEDRQIQAAVANFNPPQMRLNVRWIRGDRNIVDDSYNANPTAMYALFQIVRELVEEGRVVGLVLGEMLELGDQAEKFHSEVAEAAAQLGVSFIVAVGRFADLFVNAANKAGIRGFKAPSPEAAAHIAHKLEFDSLFVKASRGIGLDRTVKTLLDVEGEMPPEGVC